MAIVTRIFVVRHGETQENLLRIIQGQKDTTLNATGIKQAELLAERFKATRFHLAFSSDSGRAVKVNSFREDATKYATNDKNERRQRRS